MQIQNDDRCLAPRGVGLWFITSILVSGAAIAACADSNALPPGTSSSSTSASSAGPGSGGSGGSSGSTSSAGGGGGEPVECKPDSVEPCYTGDPPTKDVGVCKGGMRTCKSDGSGFGACEGEITPTPETCLTAEDDDCNGVANDTGDSCICTPLAMETCYSSDPSEIGVGVCKEGTRTCNDLGSAWSGCEGEVTPQAEICGNAADDDCNGATCGAALWSIIFGGASGDQIGGIAFDALGNIYVAGTFSGQMSIAGSTLTSAGGTDVFLAKLDSQGAHLWSQAFGDAADQGATGVATDAMNNVIAVGYFNGKLILGPTTLNANGRDAFVAKFGDTGANQWAKKTGGAGTQSAVAVVTDAMSNVFVAGTGDGDLACAVGCVQSAGGTDIFLFKFDETSNQKFLKTYGDATDQAATALAIDASGSLALVGTIKGTVDFGGGTLLGSAGGVDVFLARIDASGATLWGNRYGDAADQEPRSVAFGPAGEIAIAGTFKSAINFGALDLQSAGLSDAFLVKIGADGSYQWDRSYGDASDQTANGVVFDANGNLYVTGGFQGIVDFGGGAMTSLVSYDQFLLKVDDKGIHQWSQRYGDSASQIGKNIIIEASTGHLLISAASAGTIDYGLGPLTSAGGDDMTLVKISP